MRIQNGRFSRAPAALVCCAARERAHNIEKGIYISCVVAFMNRDADPPYSRNISQRNVDMFLSQAPNEQSFLIRTA